MMLTDRLREIDDDSIIYHYCSSESFISIVNNRTIRFSDINLLNDAEEGRWGYKVFEDAATKVINRDGIPEEVCKLIEGLDEAFVDQIDKLRFAAGLRFANFASSFSTDGDSLSQWRAYADDGRGMAIGFRVSELRRMPVQIFDIEYQYEKQVKEVSTRICSIYLEFCDKGKDCSLPWFFEACVSLAVSLIGFKNPAWRDEKEVRCQHVVDVDISDEGIWTLTDGGGVSAGKDVEGQPIRFHARQSSIVPYLDMPFEVSGERKPIVEVVLGPKNPNAPGNIMFALGNAGYGHVALKRAGAAYR
jgi:hypothetical protein